MPEKHGEYMRSKGMLNSMYGMSVTDIVRDENIYDGEWSTSKADVTKQLDKYNKSVTRFSYYLWGVWITTAPVSSVTKYSERRPISSISTAGMTETAVRSYAASGERATHSFALSVVLIRKCCGTRIFFPLRSAVQKLRRRIHRR